MTDNAQARAHQLLLESREEVGRADSKAAIILASAGVGAAALLGGLIAGSWSPIQLSNAIEWVWWLGLACLGVALVQLSRCLLPTTKNQQSGKVDYFGDVLRFSSPEALRDALSDDEGGHESRAIRQLFVISSIVERKYQRLRSALILLGAASSLFTASVLIEVWL